MNAVLVTLALPNPAGKDRTPSNQVTNQQLNGEWVEFAAQRDASIQGFTIYHRTYDGRCQRTGEERLTSFRGVLAAGQSIRIHSGSGTETWVGTVLHTYLGRGNFVWNNLCGDAAVLRDQAGSLIHWAGYDPKAPEGIVLQREQGTNHLAVAVGAFGREDIIEGATGQGNAGRSYYGARRA